MQHYALTVDKLIDHAAKWHGHRTVTTAVPGDTPRRIGYADLRVRCNRVSGALLAIGIRPGERLGTIAWNTQHHLELYYATMNVGLVCHTLNPRLRTAHLAMMIEEAEDRVLAVAASLLPLLEELLPLCPQVERIIVLDAADGATFPRRAGLTVDTLENLLAEHGAAAVWGDFDENAPAGLCYTSGTTGRPKGVVFTHRANYLHALTSIQPDGYCLSEAEVILAAVPMFHANAWGLPFSAPAVGADLVLPGRDLDGASLAALMRSEGVTLGCGVQTIWLGLLDHLERSGESLPDLTRIIVGGSKCPDALIHRLEQRLGLRVQTSWGMTEMSPIGTVDPIDARRRAERAAGRPLLGVDLKLTDAAGVTLPEQRNVVGHLKVKGASVLDRYFKADADVLDAEGYFDTGDLAIIDADGNLTISGRSKDLIKSGGEWINPAEIEEIVGRHPQVAQAAVIGKPDARWGERPILIVEPCQGEAIDPATLIDTLRGRIADWWMPDSILLATLPLAATGKIDKVRLRGTYGAGELTGSVAYDRHAARSVG